MSSSFGGGRSLLLLGLCGVTLAFAAPAVAWSGDEGFIRGGEKKGEDPAKEDDLKPFEELTRDCDTIEGLFTFYWNRDRGELWMEVEKDQLNRAYISALTREAAEGYFFDNAAMLDESIFLLRREGKKLHWIKPNLLFTAPGDSAFGKAIDRGVSASLVAALEIASRPHPETGAILVDPRPLFIQDHAGVVASLKETKSGYSLDRDGSFVDRIQSFPRNTEIEVVLSFKSDAPEVYIPILPDSRSFRHRYHWSLVERPASGYRPRLADDRVGHFLTMLADYSNTRAEDPHVRYVNRWRLEKKDPGAALSEPVEPIVYWIENRVPPEYRDAVRRGLLNWNRAFEAAGFRNAIRVEQMPDTASWDPADVRYHVVRWMLQPGGSYAVGPSRTDPLTGEIFDADIRISADITRVVFAEWHDQISPLIHPGPDGMERGECHLGEGLVNEAAFGIHLAMARGVFDPESPEGRRYLDEYIEGLVCHEAGHTLGLRHNFKSSVIHTLDQLQDTKRTKELGITGSIMDYTPVNIAREGETQGEYWQVGPGIYDLWAIEYAYKPFDAANPQDERPALDAIASRCADPLLAYATDEDARGMSITAIDPTVNLFDLTSDPIAWCVARMDLSDELWSKMDSYLDEPGQRYPRYRSVFRQGLREYFTSAQVVPKFIGGLYHRRDHVGDPNGRLPFEPVPAATQRKALDVLKERIFSETAFRFSPDLLNKLAPERFSTFSWGPWNAQRIDPPVHGLVLSIQSTSLDQLLHPITLSRIQDAELRFAESERAFTMIELFTGLTSAIWSELGSGAEIGSMRRGLQRAHLNRLIQVAVSPERGTPEDAITCARADLKWIQKGCQTALGRAGVDPMGRAHLDETRDRIAAALAAPLPRPMPDPASGPRM